MVQYLAELLLRANKGRSQSEREAARRETADVVIRLWRHRAHWSSVWPPPNVMTLLDRLAQLEDPSPFAQPKFTPSGSPWLDMLPRLDEVAREEERLVWAAGLLELGGRDNVARALKDDGPQLAEEEREVLRTVVAQYDSIRDWLAREMRREDPERETTDKTRVRTFVTRRLSELAQQRASLIGDKLAVSRSKRTRPIGRPAPKQKRRAKRTPAH